MWWWLQPYVVEAATPLEDGQLRVDGEKQGWGQRLPYTLHPTPP